MRQLARYKSHNTPEYMQQSVQGASASRWWSLLSVAVQTIIAESILRPNGSDLLEGGNTLICPPLEDLVDLNR